MNLYDEIAKVAYELFEKRGCVPGCELDDWFEAERIVRTMQVKAAKGNGGEIKTVKKKMSSVAPKREGTKPVRKTAAKKATGRKATAKKKTE